MALGVVSDMKNQKKLFTRAGKPRNQWKKVIKLWGQKLWSRFFIGSGIFHRSWTVFSDSPYQKLPPKPLHSAVTRSYERVPYFHVSHAISAFCGSILGLHGQAWWRVRHKLLGTLLPMSEPNNKKTGDIEETVWKQEMGLLLFGLRWKLYSWVIKVPDVDMVFRCCSDFIMVFPG